MAVGRLRLFSILPVTKVGRRGYTGQMNYITMEHQVGALCPGAKFCVYIRNVEDRKYSVDEFSSTIMHAIAFKMKSQKITTKKEKSMESPEL
jgi:hypothetical protein